MFNLLSDLLSVPLRLCQIPADLIAEAASTIDPNDDAAIRSTARQLANVYNLPFQATEHALRRALRS